jgi:hypothetical protein
MGAGTAPAGDGFNFANVQLEAGTQFTGFEYRPAAIELQIAQRFYCKSFALAIQPAQNVTGNGVHYFTQSGLASVSQWLPSMFYFPVSMRVSTPAVTLYNPSNVNAQLHNLVTGSDWTACSAAMTGNSSFGLVGTPPAGSAAGQQSYFHWTADAEI